jgi:hypothetical protein
VKDLHSRQDDRQSSSTELKHGAGQLRMPAHVGLLTPQLIKVRLQYVANLVASPLRIHWWQRGLSGSV